MDWSHILKLTKLKTCIQMSLMNDSTPSVTRWLEMVKIARKGFEVLKRSRFSMKGKSTYTNYNVIVQEIKPSHYQITVDTTVHT